MVENPKANQKPRRFPAKKNFKDAVREALREEAAAGTSTMAQPSISATSYASRTQSRPEWPVLPQRPDAERFLRLPLSRQPVLIPQQQPTLLVYSDPSGADESPSKASDRTMELLDAKVNPTTERWRLVQRRKVKNGVALQFSPGAKTTLAEKKKELENRGFKVKEPRKTLPRLLIHDVPKSISKDELVSIIKSETNSVVEQEVNVVFETGRRKDDTTSWVVEVDASTREHFKNSDWRLYAGWKSCRMEDFLRISRCYKCQELGHISKHCRQEKETCSICGKEGHSHKLCQPGTKETCSNCKKARKPSDHSVRSPECPTYLRAIAALTSKTDYGC